MNNPLVDTLRKLDPTGPDGFEGLIAKSLSILTGRYFHLARSGSQFGRDLSMRHPNCNVVAVECKRYGQDNELKERLLLGELVQAAHSIRDLDLWVLVASRSVPSQLYEVLHAEARKNGIEFLAISSADGTPSSLDLLSAQAAETVTEHVQNVIDTEQSQALQDFLAEAAAFPHFSTRIDQLREDFLTPFIGFENWRIAQNQWFAECLGSERQARSTFGQLLNVADTNVGLVPRQTAWTRLSEWLSQWHETRMPLAVLGEEGDGKSWAVASWLTQCIRDDENFPPVVFLSSSSVESSDAEQLLSTAIARRQRSIRDTDWQSRIVRWFSKAPSNAPLALLVLDGINERRAASWWRALLEQLNAAPYFERVALLITCRTAYWERHFGHLRFLETETYVLPPFDDDELTIALEAHSLKRSDIGSELLPLIRKPRYFDLMVKYRERVSESGDVTPARLTYEDWRDRLQRKRDLELSDEAFQDMIRDLAREYLSGSQSFKGQEIENLLPPVSDKLAVLEELRTGGVLRGSGNHYRVDEHLLTHGFGLLLVDQLRREAGRVEQDLQDVLWSWLEPHAGIDIKAAICEAAALHALSQPEIDRRTRVALLQAWLNSQNPGPSVQHNLASYLPLAPSSYTDLAEIVWSDRDENQWAQELLMHSFIRWGEVPKVKEALLITFKRWLGFVHIYGFDFQRGKTAEDREKVQQEICSRVGRELSTGPFMFAGHYLTAIDDDGLLRLGRTALAILSHMPRSQHIRAMATGCLAEAIMGHPDRYYLYQWIMSTAQESVWDEVETEVEQLLADGSTVAQQAAYRLLSSEGSRRAFELRQTLPQDLFPKRPGIEEHQADPCMSGFSWKQEECENCLQREELEPHWMIRQAKPHFVNPNLSMPADLGARLAPLVDAISLDSLWVHLGRTDADLLFSDCECALCACSPYAIAELVLQVARQACHREEMSLRQLAIRLCEHSLILGQAEREAIYCAWSQILEEPVPWTEAKKVAEWYLFGLVLERLSPEEQLLHLLLRPADAPDLLRYEHKFRPISNWDTVWQALESNQDSITIKRILWFLSMHPQILPGNTLQEKVLPFLNHEDSIIRALVLKILSLIGEPQSAKVIVEGSWAWNSDHCWMENEWGSILLSAYGKTLPYSELRCRVHPIRLGYAIRCRGTERSEVEQYAEDIQRIWLRIGSDAPNLPDDFPALDIEANPEVDTDSGNQVRTSRSAFARSATYFSRSASWGGRAKFSTEDWGETLSSSVEDKHQRLKQIVRETIAEQLQAGNDWFARDFYVDGLDAVIHQHPDLVDLWLETGLSDRAEAVQYLHLANSFYVALCQVLLEDAPEKGVELYWQLQGAGTIRLREADSEVLVLDRLLFAAEPSPSVTDAWRRKLEGCKTDQDLLYVAAVAQHADDQQWLWKYVKERARSAVPLEKTRAMALLAFIESSEGFELIEELLDEHSDTWVSSLLETSKERWQRNSWAKHWFRLFFTAEDDIEAWAAFRLFLQCVDSRFWLWRKQIQAQVNSVKETDHRRTFIDDNLGTIQNRIKENEKEMEKQFLGQDTLRLKYQVWPWI